MIVTIRVSHRSTAKEEVLYGAVLWEIKDLDCFALFKMEERKLSDSAHPSHDESMEEGGLSSTVKPSPPISLKELALTHGVEGKTFRAIGR